MTQRNVVLFEKLTVEDLSLLRHDAVSIGNHLPTFRRGLIAQSSVQSKVASTCRNQTGDSNLHPRRCEKTLIIKPIVV